MRLRSTIPAAAATALLAAILAVPGQAVADGRASGSPTGAPTISFAGSDKDDPGVLEIDATAASPIDQLTATLTPTSFSGTPIQVTSFHLVSGTTTAGVWRTDRLQLATHGYYAVSADVFDSAGNHLASPATGQYRYLDMPVLHDVNVSPTALSAAQETVTASGRVTTYDPAKGDTGLPFTEWGFVDLTAGYTDARGYFATDGTFSVPFRPTWQFTSTTFQLMVTSQAGIVMGPSTTVTMAAPSASRIVLDHPWIRSTYGTQNSISGTVQFLDASGAWQPAPDASLQLDQNSYTSDRATSDANGRFTFTEGTPSVSVTWPIHLAAGGDPFLQPSSTTFTMDVPSQVSIRVDNTNLDEFSQLTLQGQVYSSRNPAHLPGDHRLYVQWSGDGRSWTTLGWVPTAANGYFDVHPYVAVAHGYWRLFFPSQGVDYPAAYSAPFHYVRNATRVTGGKPSVKRAYRNQLLRFSGTLQQYSGGAWRSFRSAQVLLLFRPTGSRTWYLMSTAMTDRYGRYWVSAHDPRGGTWMVAYLNADSAHLDSVGTQTWVGVS